MVFMNPLKRIFFIVDQHIIPVAEAAYQALLDKRSGAGFTEYANLRVKTADIEVDPNQLSPYGIVKTEFRYTVFDGDGFLDLADIQSYVSLRTKALNGGNRDDPESEFRKKHCWIPTSTEFKMILKLSLVSEFNQRSVALKKNKKLPYDKTNPKVDHLCKLIGTFPGLEVVGNNLALDRWSALFDVVDSSGLVSIIFLLEGLKLEMIQDLDLLLYSPDRDMRYSLSAPQNRDAQKISLWLVHLYQKRLQYKRTL
jgi:hypothetical protein